MLRYINAESREDCVILAATVEYLRDIASRWEKLKRPKPVIRFIRIAASIAYRASAEFYKELTEEDIERVYRMAATARINFTYTAQGLSNKAPGVTTYDITEDERDKIVEALTEVNCTSCKKNCRDCTVASQFFKWDVPPVREAVPEGECPYFYKEG